MPQQLLNDLHIDSHAKQYGRRTVPEIIKMHMWDASFMQYFLEHPKKIIRVEVPTMQIKKYKIAILPEKFIADVQDSSPKKLKLLWNRLH